MKKQGSEHGGKHESRFPWVFKTEGSLQYFGKINRRVIYFSSKEVDIKLISEDIQTSPLLAVAADVWQNKVVRVLTICSKKSVFVISLNVGYVISSLSSFLSSLNSKIIVGYGLDFALSILKKEHGISLNVRDLLTDQEYGASFKEFRAKKDIQEFITNAENDIQAVAKFDYLLALSNQVIAAISQPAVLAFNFITSVEDQHPQEILMPHQIFQERKDISFSIPFAPLPAEKTSPIKIPFAPIQPGPRLHGQTIPQEIPAPVSNTKDKESPTKPSSPQQQPQAKTRLQPKSYELSSKANVSEKTSPKTTVKRTESVKPLIIQKTRTETPPPRENDVNVPRIEGRKRKESLPLKTSPPIIVKKQENRHAIIGNPVCPICNDPLNSTVGVAAHLVAHHGLESILTSNFQRVGCPNYVCAICNQYFMSKDTFILHVVGRHTKDFYDVLVKSRIPESRDVILKFMAAMASEVSEPILQNTWESIAKLEKDMKRRGVINTQQKCIVCNKTFETATELLYHCYHTHCGD